MTVHLVTFSDEQMSRSAQLCQDSAFKAGGVDFATYYTPSNIRKCQTVLDHAQVFRQPEDPRRAWAWWAWKPLIISQEFILRNAGDLIVYADAGVEFINNVSHIIDRMGHDKPQDDIWLFGNNWDHAHWCKRDVIDAVWPLLSGTNGPPSTGWEAFGKQCQASVILFRVSDYSRQFVAEWLKWCLSKVESDFLGDRYLIDDSPSTLPNHPEFREHRHDQAILTTLAYREGIKLHYWPAMYNDGAFSYEKLPCYAGDDYPILFHHHRRRNADWGQTANE